MEITEKTKLTPANLIAMTMADIDIFLLREDDQETDKNKVFTVDEIRHHLELTIKKISTVCRDLGLDMDSPIPLSDVRIN